MARKLTVSGCDNTAIHAAHEHEVGAVGNLGGVEKRQCPGRVRCAVCRKAVFATTVQPLGTVTGGGRPTGGWKCAPRCRR
jgi:hypothetical protein